MPKIVDETQRQDEIAEAAVSVFAENGFSGTAVKRIAEEADMAPGNIYRYFESKADILRYIFDEFEQTIHHAFDRVLDSSRDPLQKFEDLMNDLSTLAQLYRPTITVLFDFWSHSLHSTSEAEIDFESFYGQLRTKIGDLIEEGVRQGIFRSMDDDALSSVVIGAFEGQLIQWLVDPSSPPLDDVRKSVFNVIMNGMTE